MKVRRFLLCVHQLIEQRMLASKQAAAIPKLEISGLDPE